MEVKEKDKIYFVVVNKRDEFENASRNSFSSLVNVEVKVEHTIWLPNDKIRGVFTETAEINENGDLVKVENGSVIISYPAIYENKEYSAEEILERLQGSKVDPKKLKSVEWEFVERSKYESASLLKIVGIKEILIHEVENNSESLLSFLVEESLLRLYGEKIIVGDYEAIVLREKD